MRPRHALEEICQEFVVTREPDRQIEAKATAIAGFGTGPARQRQVREPAAGTGRPLPQLASREFGAAVTFGNCAARTVPVPSLA